MKHSRQLGIAAFCAAASLFAGMTGCDDSAGSFSSSGKLGDACSDSVPCETGLVCEGGVCAEKVDEPQQPEKAALGESCGDDKLCEDGLVCGESGKCEEKTTEPEKAALGESCGDDIVCEDGLVCGESGKCEEKSTQPAEPVVPDPGIKEDPCEGVSCPDGKQCLNAKCYDPECIVDGEEKACESGKMCSKGECVDDGCQDKVCGEGEVCAKGLCEDALCLESGIVCNDGATCVKGACVDNECLSMTCDEGLTCSKGSCVFPACVGKEPCASGKICNESGECVFAEAPNFVVSALDTQTDENGDTAVIFVNLNNPPAADVKLVCEISPESASAEAELSCENIIFNADNYADSQAITVIGLPDKVIDEDQKYKVILKTETTDPDFSSLTYEIDMVNVNVDKVGVTVEGADNLVTTESGGKAEFTVVLNSKPEADVTFVVSTDNPEYGVISGGEGNKVTVTFTPENWNVPQTVTLQGVDDDENVNGAEGHVYHVIFEKTVSEDGAYNGLDIDPLTVTNIDNDIADAFLDKTEIETTEGGAPVDVRIRLGLEPQEPVSVSIKLFTAEDGSEVTKEAVLLTENKLTLDKNNYKEGLVMSFQGQIDNFIDGDQNYVVRLRFTSDDDRYVLNDKFIKGVNKDMDEAGLIKSYTDTTVSESGTSVDIGLTLASIPTEPVTVTMTTSDEEEMRVSPNSLTFTAENWNVPQFVTAKGVDDLIVDGDQTSQINFKLSTEGETPFNGLEDTIDIVTLDNDVAQIVVASTGTSLAEDSDATVEFKVTLSAMPDENVMVSMVSSDESELKILGQTALQFTPENWNVPQTVMLKVQDDSFADGQQDVVIKLTSSSTDPNFDGLLAQTETYSILDNESASVTLTSAKTMFKPGEPNTTKVTVALSSPPEKDVPVKLSATNNATVKFSKSDLIFTTSNWETPQEVTMTTTAGAAPSAKSTVKISALASGSGSYKNLKSKDVELTLYAFLSQNFGYLGKEESVTLLPGNYRLQVWGAEGNAQYEGGYGGKGGYSIGTYKLNAKTTFYVNVGGKPYNGGGSGQCVGGGATHIATASGLLSSLSSKQSSVLIVAGGGGGGERETGGYGGGVTGSNGIRGQGLCSPVTVTPKGATQSSGGAAGTVNNGFGTGSVGTFGKGGDGGCSSNANGYCDVGSGGGGGWYGGGGIPYCGAGGGGSGHLGKGVSGSTVSGNTSFVAPGGSNETGHAGTGYARITLLD